MKRGPALVGTAIRRTLLVGVSGLAALLAACAGGGPAEFSLNFSESEVQAALDKAEKSRELLDGLLRVSVEGSPQVRLGEPTERIGLQARLSIRVSGVGAMPANVKASSGLRYDVTAKAFFLDAPRLESIDAPLLPRALEGTARKLITRQLDASFAQTPVYTLKADGSLKEQAARGLLKSVRIEPGRVVAVFSPV